ncbi:hypothetical protein [Natronococcus occultus]|uniref:Uncharacterized protein n=1 Tax=Natronococcus occultus SP4 TaxID=694430 RepID=L0JZM0_9EURY|nr:hypothetical protein [Natronococcus occultus]AGB37750.1 hypothetical protein Natoc_1960 [Natronococcus occultus SP4]
MCETFTEADVGNRVETADGETVGVVAVVDGSVARVSPVPATDHRDSATPAMATGPDETRTLEPSAVRERAAERLVLEDGRSIEFESSSANGPGRATSSEDAAETLEDVGSQCRGVDAEPTAVADSDPEPRVDPEDPETS